MLGGYVGLASPSKGNNSAHNLPLEIGNGSSSLAARAKADSLKVL